jgi:hypothetical protein
VGDSDGARLCARLIALVDEMQELTGFIQAMENAVPVAGERSCLKAFVTADRRHWRHKY